MNMASDGSHRKKSYEGDGKIRVGICHGWLRQVGCSLPLSSLFRQGYLLLISHPINLPPVQICMSRSFFAITREPISMYNAVPNRCRHHLWMCILILDYGILMRYQYHIFAERTWCQLPQEDFFGKCWGDREIHHHDHQEFNCYGPPLIFSRERSTSNVMKRATRDTYHDVVVWHGKYVVGTYGCIRDRLSVIVAGFDP